MKTEARILFSFCQGEIKGMEQSYMLIIVLYF